MLEVHPLSDDGASTGRRLQILLDRVANLAANPHRHLLDPRSHVLDDDERKAKQSLTELVEVAKTIEDPVLRSALERAVAPFAPPDAIADEVRQAP